MKHAWLVIAGVVLLAGCEGSSPASSPSAGASTAAAAPSSTVPAGLNAARYDGYGHMRFGMNEPAFRRAWQGELQGTASTDGGCYYLAPKWAKSAAVFGFMFEQGHFVRYDVGNANETAPGGGKVGMTVPQIRALYGNHVEQSPHKYEQGAFYLRITGQGQNVLLFETDAAGKITRWRVGVPPQIDYVEGCS